MILDKATLKSQQYYTVFENHQKCIKHLSFRAKIGTKSIVDFWRIEIKVARFASIDAK